MKEKIAGLSILANVILASGKIFVGIISNSAAILSSGIDSLVDIFSSIVSFVGIKIAKKPADEKHPYGHYKYEVLGGVVITIIILITGLGIIYDSYQNFLHPGEITINYLAFSVMVFSVLVNGIMSKLKIKYGQKENSISLLSDGVHSKIDVYTSLAILIGLFLTKYWIHADAVLSFLMGLYIIKGAFSIGKEAIGSLLDVSADKEIEEKMKLVVKEQNIELDSLKTQKKGSIITANLEIKLKKDLKIEEATKISNSLREKLMKEIENLQYVSIQIKSHEVETSFYQPRFGKSFGWQRKGKFQKDGQGPGGYCVCPECDYKIKHKRGTPCSHLKCPSCQVDLKRNGDN